MYGLSVMHSGVMIVPALSFGYPKSLFSESRVSLSATFKIRLATFDGISSIISSVSSTNKSFMMFESSLSVKAETRICCVSLSISTKTSGIS